MLPYLTQLLCPGIAILLQDGPDDLSVTDIHLAAVGLQVHCKKGRVTQEPAQLPSTACPSPCSAGTSPQRHHWSQANSTKAACTCSPQGIKRRAGSGKTVCSATRQGWAVTAEQQQLCPTEIKHSGQ